MDTATTEIYTYLHSLSLHDALPISTRVCRPSSDASLGWPFGIDEAAVVFPRKGLLQTRITLDADLSSAESVRDGIHATGRAPTRSGRGSPRRDRKSTRLNSSH